MELKTIPPCSTQNEKRKKIVENSERMYEKN